VDARRRAAVVGTALAGLLAALLAGFFTGTVPGLSAATSGGTPTVNRTATSQARAATYQQGAVLAHSRHADREAGSGSGPAAACLPASASAFAAGAGVAVSSGRALGGSGYTGRCVDGRAPPAAAAIAVPLSLG
jgi:hypothetical protein